MGGLHTNGSARTHFVKFEVINNSTNEVVKSKVYSGEDPGNKTSAVPALSMDISDLKGIYRIRIILTSTGEANVTSNRYILLLPFKVVGK